jgi:hypothetical protein
VREVGDGVKTKENVSTKSREDILFSSSWAFSVLLDCHAFEAKREGRIKMGLGSHFTGPYINGQPKPTHL